MDGPLALLARLSKRDVALFGVGLLTGFLLASQTHETQRFGPQGRCLMRVNRLTGGRSLLTENYMCRMNMYGRQ